MYAKMIEKLETYQEEALECETLVMATLLHPTFRLKLFTHCWPEKANNAKALLEQHFQKRNDILKKKENDDKLLEKTKPTIINPDNIFDLFEAPETNDKTKELEVYIKNMDRLQGPSAKDPQSLLTWWKDHSSTYPVLASLAKDFLASSASSCAVERTFSLAANVCSSGRGSLKPRKIEQCVSGDVCLKEGIQVSGSFDKAQKIIKIYAES
ncbi:hypothetical protein VP01_142g12 [Puccinia sorghi]|uniref:HAT C-terminal dimerisation domain-containing protein n=1 Tax=Puccinia sorghi TaxID=27349 RepID=A0A0L6VKZ4_9BASI|nr:hypothetical protein VP01_142g12 [Puccinia sorghi]